MRKENGGPAKVWQYYYHDNACNATSERDADCICWHDEGAGPHSEASHKEEIPTLEWRTAARSKP